MNIMFVDSETNGLPKNYKAPASDVQNWPRVIQLAWIMTDEKGLIKDLDLKLIKPDGWVMPTAPFWVDNGFTQEKSMAEGHPITEALQTFINAQLESDLLVSHNIQFDYPILSAELLRAGMKGKWVPKICTKEAATEFCQLPAQAKWMGYKWPKLEELYLKLFGKDMQGAHDAMKDVEACKECFFELVRLNIISIPKI